MKLKNNTDGFYIIVLGNYYKIPEGIFKVPEEIGFLLLTLSDVMPFLKIENIDKKIVFTDDIKRYIINKYSNNGIINLTEVELKLGRRLVSPVSYTVNQIFNKKKTYLLNYSK